MVSLDDLVQHVQNEFEDAGCGVDCPDHGVQGLVKMGSEDVCRDCLSEFVHNTLQDLDNRFHILAGIEDG